MTVGDIAGLIAAVAFVLLVGLCAVPLLKLGRVLDELRLAIRDVGRSSTPILDELKETVSVTNDEISRIGLVTADVARVSAHATTVAERTATMSKLIAATMGRPLVKTAATTHGLRAAVAAKMGRTA